MRRALLIVLAAGLVAPVIAIQPAGTPATKAPGAAQPAAAAPEQPMPKAIPVPDGPVVNRQELAGGLIVEDLTVGDGYEVKPGGAVVAFYHGTLKDGGKVFDSAFQRGEPIAFPLSGVIPGWQQGVPGMKVGGVRRLTIPAALGYGERGAGADIPPNSDLVFVIQLVDALQIEDVEVGQGEEASGQCVPATEHRICDKEGKELAKTEDGKPYIWLPGEMNPPGSNFDTMQIALTGMKVGGKRKIKIPKEMNVSPPQLQTQRPQNVPIEVEVELVAVRNLPRR